MIIQNFSLDMPVAKPVIGRYSKTTSAPQAVNLAAGDSFVKKNEKPTGNAAYETWLSRLAATLRWRQSVHDKNWKRAYSMYTGVHWRDQSEHDPSSDQVRERITVNITMSTVLNIVPFLMNQTPEFRCKPRKPEKALAAKLQQAVLNYEYEQRNMDDQLRMAVLDAAIIGHGIVKVGYNFEIDKAKKKVDGEIVYEDYIKQDSPYVQRICPFYFLLDPTASENNLETASWCAQILFKSGADVCANQRYDQSVIRKIQLGFYSPDTRSTVFSDGVDPSVSSLVSDDVTKLPEHDLWVLYEVWSKKHKKYFVFASGVPEPLLEKDSPYEYIDGFPFHKLDYIPLPDELYGAGIPYSIEDQQFELNRIRTAAFEHRRRFNRKYLALKGKVSQTEANKLIESPDGTVIFVDMFDCIKPLEDAPLSQDNLVAEQMIREDIRQLTGSDQLISGGQLPSRTTGTEVQSRTSLFRMKMDDRIKAVDKFVVRIATQVLQHIKNNFREDRFVEILGEEGLFWKLEKLSSEQIKEDVDVSMETISAPKVDPTVDRQQRMTIFGMCMQALPLVQAGIFAIDINKLFAWTMEGFGYKDIGKFFAPALLNYGALRQQQAPQQGQQPAGVAPAQTNFGSPAPVDMMQQNGFGALLGQMNGGIQ